MADIRDIATPAVEHYRAPAEAAKDCLPGLSALRGKAAALLGQTLPLGKAESWKYTDMRRYFRSPADIAPRPDAVSRKAIEPFLIPNTDRAVFVDGYYFAALSDFDGCSLDEKSVGTVADLERSGLIALNTALMRDGLSIHVEKNLSLEKPVHLLFLTSDGFAGESHSRVTVTLDANSAATVIETHAALGAGTGLTDHVVEFSVGPGAALRHVVLQQAADGINHIATRAGRLEKDAKLIGFHMATGAALSRAETVLSLAGEGAEASLSGISLMRGRQHCDVTTDISHDVPHCHSDQVFKNVVDERGRTVFQGRVYVAPDAQATDAHQLNRNLLLSRDAQADAKPELVIHADDVKCSHGATVGDLEEEALFYLRSRGVPANEARSLLIKGFAAELFEKIQNPAISARLEGVLESWLVADGKERAAA